VCHTSSGLHGGIGQSVIMLNIVERVLGQPKDISGLITFITLSKTSMILVANLYLLILIRDKWKSPKNTRLHNCCLLTSIPYIVQKAATHMHTPPMHMEVFPPF